MEVLKLKGSSGALASSLDQPARSALSVKKVRCQIAPRGSASWHGSMVAAQELLRASHTSFLGHRWPISSRNSSRTLPNASGRSIRAQAVSKTVEWNIHGVLEDVPNVRDWLPDLPLLDSPLKIDPVYKGWVEQDPNYFISSDETVSTSVVTHTAAPRTVTHYRRAGPREKIVFQPANVRAAIVTCGGLCPGLNTVVRELVCALWKQYGVREVFGIQGGYRGFYAKNTLQLTPRVVSDIHKRGGSTLGTSRGGHSTEKIVNSIEDRGINQVYIIGGDGTQRGALAIHEECKRRGLKVAVAGIPKTIDNDIAVIDKSFGFDTAVEEAQRAINAAKIEAASQENGIGLVKLMGRYSGYIAMYATLGSRDVDLCLIPEVPFFLGGKGGLFEFVRRRLRENGHMVMVIAEGAGQDVMREMGAGQHSLQDLSGNALLLDCGLWLGQQLKAHLKGEINLKYIDPTYMIRAVPSNASDNVYCTLLAHSAVHGVMAGYTGFTVGPVNGRHSYIPIQRVTEKTNKVNPNDRMWARLVNSTNQPDFRPETHDFHSGPEEQTASMLETLVDQETGPREAESQQAGINRARNAKTNGAVLSTGTTYMEPTAETT